MTEKYRELAALIDGKDESAYSKTLRLVDENPDDPVALHLAGKLFTTADQYGVAYQFLKRSLDVSGAHQAHNNLGMCLEGMDRYKEAEKHFEKAIKADPKSANYLANLAVCKGECGERLEQEKLARKAIALDPAHTGAHTSLAFSLLAQGRYKEGWSEYKHTLGGKFRKLVNYNGEPMWDGEPGNVVVYGEQGLGDEIFYARNVPKVPNAILECDSRLEGLFRRSFNVPVYGTRRATEVDWLDKHEITYSCPSGHLTSIYGLEKSGPYLKADDERVLQWKALFKSFGKPVIGLCWTGGSKHNHPNRRAMGPDSFIPLRDTVDAVYVSLEYKPGEARDWIREYPRATRTPDYDDTAGLVAALDCVIGIHTSVHHLAGALGVPSYVMVPDKCSWLYARDPWYEKTQFFRQLPKEAWNNTVKRFVSDTDFCWLR